MYSSPELDGWISADCGAFGCYPAEINRTSDLKVAAITNFGLVRTHSFLSFRIESFAAAEISSATLEVFQTGVTGEPFSSDDVYVDMVDYGSTFESGDFSVDPLSAQIGVISSSPSSGWRSLDLTNELSLATQQGRDLFQLRLRFLQDGINGSVNFRSGEAAGEGYAPRLHVVYQQPSRPNLEPFTPQGWSAPIVVSAQRDSTLDTPTLRSDDALFVDLALINTGEGTTSGRFLAELRLNGEFVASWFWDVPFETNNWGDVRDFSLGSLAEGSHQLELIVDSTDSQVESDESDNIYLKTISISAVDQNAPPSANAGADQEVTSGATVFLSGSGSDPDGDTLSYEWMQISGPSVSLSSRSSPSPSFQAPEVSATTTLTFRLTVSDGQATASDAVRITVQPDTSSNQPPTADAGADQVVSEGALVLLQGSGSDPDGDVLTFTWVQTDTTSEAPTVTLMTPTAALASFVAPETDREVTLNFQLTVDDRRGGMASDSVQVTVTPERSSSPSIETIFPATLSVPPDNFVEVSQAGARPGKGSALSRSKHQTSSAAALTNVRRSNLNPVAVNGPEGW